MKIALTGGIACGKSLVARFLREAGVATIDADDIVHELLPDPAERRRIAAEVFADPEKRQALEARLHPLVKERIDQWLNWRIGELANDAPSTKHRALGTQHSALSTKHSEPRATNPEPRTPNHEPRTTNHEPRLAIIPLLFETHWDADYDIICCVTSDRETQISRMMTTRGYTREEAEARMAAQMPVREKAAKSHYVIENNGSAEELKSKVAAFVAWLTTKTKNEQPWQTNSTYSQGR